MTTDEALEVADQALLLKTGKHLTDLQRAILQGSLENKKYHEIEGYDVQHIKNEGSKLWVLLSEVLGEKVSKNNFQAALKRRWQSHDLSPEPVIETILANPLNQILLFIPLSIIGKFSTDTIKTLFNSLKKQEKLKDLEEIFFSSFLKSIDIHKYRYNSVPIAERIKLSDLASNRKSEFIKAIKTFVPNEGFHVSAKLDEDKMRQLLIQKIIEVFKEYIPKENLELVKAITRDTTLFYREAFFQEISQEQHLWIIFKENLKITSIVDLIKQIQQQIPTREEFEVIRNFIVINEVIPEDIQKLKQRYLNYLERKFSSIELTGVSPRVHGQDISFELEEIFIPFNIGDNDSAKNTLTVIQEDRSKYAVLFKENEPLVDDKIKLLQNLTKFSQIVLLGDPGGGKTTLLKYITYQMCKFQRQNTFLPFYLPVFLRISEYAHVIKSNPSKRLVDFLLYDYDKQFANLFQWAFENRQVLLLLDGLDEVLDTSQRIRIVEQVQDIVARMPENRYIVTSRIIGYDSARISNNFKHFTIQKFNRQQINAFCCSWYKAVAKNSSQDMNSALLEAERLYKAITNKRDIENLACNPLMITLIANIHFKGQNLPHSRVQLYDIATETLLQYWVQHRVSDGSQLKDKDDVIEILSPVAFYIYKNNPEGLITESNFYEQCRIILKKDEYNLNPKEIKKEIKELIIFLREQSGFFHEKGVDESTGTRYFGFIHQTFQEYLTAIEIVNLWKEGVLDFYSLLQNLRWTESFRLAAGILNTEKGRSRKRSTTKFAEDILNVAENSESIYIPAILLLSLILVDNIDFTPQIQDYLFQIIFNIWRDNINNNKTNDEIEKHIAFLFQSKYRDIVWEKIQSIIEQNEHPLHSKIPKFITKNLYIITQEVKEYFIQSLTTKKSLLCISAWKALKESAYNAEQSLYYEAEYYGGIYGIPDEPISGIAKIIRYTSLVETINLVPEEIFPQIMSMAIDTLNSYLWIWFTPEYCSTYSTKYLVSELNKNESENIRILLISLLEKQNDLSSFKNDVEEILQNTSFNNKLFEEIKHKIIDKISRFNDSSGE